MSDNVEVIRDGYRAWQRFTRFIIRGRAHGSGLGTELEVGWPWTLRVGRAVRSRAYLEAAGLEE